MAAANIVLFSDVIETPRRFRASRVAHWNEFIETLKLCPETE
jgi:hypothetical protein